jgi:NAD(P)H-nitrite reductase large subunit
VKVIKNRRVTKICTVEENKLAITLNSGKRLRANMVVIGKGVTPNIAFTEGTPIERDWGLFVNARMETSVPGIFAAGDVAEPRDRVTGHRKIHGIWPEAVNQGRVAGTNLAGRKLNYIGALRANVTHILGQTVAVAGDVQAARVTDCVVSKDPAKPFYRKIAFDEDGRILGAILINSYKDIGIIQNLIRSGRKVPFLKEEIATSPIGYGRVSQP